MARDNGSPNPTAPERDTPWVPSELGDAARAAWERLRRAGPRQWIKRERDAFAQTAKTALACVLAWLIAKQIFHSAEPVLAPAAALIVMQVTIYQSITRSVQYSIGVLFGVGIALGIGNFYQFTWYTLLVIVVGSLVLGRTLRLGPQVNQVATTGLFVFVLGHNYALERLYDTVIGAITGIAVNALVAPPNFTRTAAKELADLADDLAGLAKHVARGLESEWSHEDSARWLDRGRALTSAARTVRSLAEQAHESVRFHPRRSAHLEEVEHVLSASTCLNHVAIQLNTLVRGLNDMSSTGERGVPGESLRLPTAIVELVDESGDALALFGQLQLPDRGAPRYLEELRVALRSAGEQRPSAVEEVLPTEDEPILLWPIYGSLLDSVLRVLYEIDPDHGPHRTAIPAEVRAVLGSPDGVPPEGEVVSPDAATTRARAQAEHDAEREVTQDQAEHDRSTDR